jgi:hypothetical protein
MFVITSNFLCFSLFQELFTRGSGPKNVIFSNGPKIIFEWSSLLYYVWIWYAESFVKKIAQNPPVGCVKLSLGISGRKSHWVLLGFIVVCLLCWLKYCILNIWSSILSYYDWKINKITLDLCQNPICNILNPLIGCIKLAFGTGGRQKMLVFAQFSSGTLPLLTQ